MKTDFGLHLTPPINNGSALIGAGAESYTAACFNAGYPLAGTEYTDECCQY